MKTEMNKTIADYMGVTYYPEKGTKEYNKWKGERKDTEIYHLGYDSDWNKLIPVIEKLRKQRLDIYGDTDGMGNIFSHLMSCNITLTHKYVANYIASLALKNN